MKWYSLALFTCLSVSAMAFAAEKKPKEKVLKICSEAGYVPFEMVDQKGRWDGYEVKLLEHFGELKHIKVQFKNMSYDGLIPSLVARKDCDLVASTLAVNLERGNSVQFSDPILITYFSAIVRTADAQKYQTFDAINSKETRMAVQNGTENDSYVKKYAHNVKVLGFSNNIDPVTAVIMNKADIYIEDVNYLKLMKKKYPEKVSLVDPKILVNNPNVAIAFAMRKTDKNLIKEINDYLKEIADNGELKKIQKDYFEDMIWMKDFPL